MQNHFWFDEIDKSVREKMTEIYDSSSMFFYLAAASFLLLLFQTCFFVVKVMGIENFTSLERFLDPVNFQLSLDIGGLQPIYTIPLAIAAYMAINLVSNSLVRARNIVPSNRTRDARVSPNTGHGHRIEYVLLGIVLTILYFFVISPAIVRPINWFTFIDPLLLGLFFVLFVTSYWAGAHEYFQFFVNYDRYFEAKKDGTLSYLVHNSARIEKIHNKICGQIEKAEGSTVEDCVFHICSHCKSSSADTVSCHGCGRELCRICALNLGNCPNCGQKISAR